MVLSWKLQTPFFRCHGKALERAAVIQGLALMEISGIWKQDAHRFLVLGCVAYWIIVLLIMLRREDNMTSTDRLLIDWGFVPMVIALVVYALFFAHL
jgi:hypothetical protein